MNDFGDHATCIYDHTEPAPGAPYRASVDVSDDAGSLVFTFTGHPYGVHALHAYATQTLATQGARDLARIEFGTEPLPDRFRLQVDAVPDYVNPAGGSVTVSVYATRRVGACYCAAVTERFLAALTSRAV